MISVHHFTRWSLNTPLWSWWRRSGVNDWKMSENGRWAQNRGKIGRSPSWVYCSLKVGSGELITFFPRSSIVSCISHWSSWICPQAGSRSKLLHASLPVVELLCWYFRLLGIRAKHSYHHEIGKAVFYQMRLWWALWLHPLEGIPLSPVSRFTPSCEKWTLLATSTTTPQSTSCSQAHSCHLHQWKLFLVHISWHPETLDSPSAPEHTQPGLATKVQGFPSVARRPRLWCHQ